VLFVVYDSNGGELILESAKGVILIPQCSNVSEVTLVETKNCYKNIPAKFKVGEEDRISSSGL
jgi:hypothetical protein